MANALRISDAASLALHAAVLLGASPDRRLSAAEMAETLCVSEAHLAKVLQRLAHVGLVHSVRGPGGGFTLGKPCDQVSLLDLYEAIEGPLGDTVCLLGTPSCHGGCLLGGLLDDVNALVRQRLSTTMLCALPNTFGSRPERTPAGRQTKHT